MKKFKCIDNRNGEYFLTVGRVYEEDNSEEPLHGYIHIKNDDGWCNHYKDVNFEVVEENPPVTVKKFKCIDTDGYRCLTVGDVYEVSYKTNGKLEIICDDDGDTYHYNECMFEEVVDEPVKVAPTFELDAGTSAGEILKKASEALANRAVERDHEEGTERSMVRITALFNAYSGRDLTETEGWIFAMCLKMGRSANGNFREDDFVDMAAYAALAGESAAKE